jgi:DNA polymerase-1
MQNLLKQQSVCFDTETTGLDACRLVGFPSLTKKEKLSTFLPENQEEAQN